MHLKKRRQRHRHLRYRRKNLLWRHHRRPRPCRNQSPRPNLLRPTNLDPHRHPKCPLLRRRPHALLPQPTRGAPHRLCRWKCQSCPGRRRARHRAERQIPVSSKNRGKDRFRSSGTTEEKPGGSMRAPSTRVTSARKFPSFFTASGQARRQRVPRYKVYPVQSRSPFRPMPTILRIRSPKHGRPAMRRS